ncbi:MAG TPA: TlyA family RNA methyltransferase [Candidatus Saccharimonadales bacterium]|nr:TlyA family RNA methyltransferase [Candidatus Saccharimonadales bacterium]
MKRLRLDQALVERRMVSTRSQAENYIKLGYVQVNSQVAAKAGMPVSDTDQIKVTIKQQYVSRAALKLASVAEKFELNFKDKIILDVGSSTGGFTDYALRHGAKKVIAVDVGANQLHPSLRDNPKVELHEQTDIRNFEPHQSPDIVLVDVSFISLREVLPYIADLCDKNSQIVALLKPQFEASKEAMNKGVIKNDKLRRQTLKDFEQWSKKLLVVKNKADSSVAGAHGNLERFYLLSKQ